jgi:hypothetical protein
VQEAIAKVKTNPKLKALLEQLKNYPNIPRKQAKFVVSITNYYLYAYNCLNLGRIAVLLL